MPHQPLCYEGIIVQGYVKRRHMRRLKMLEYFWPSLSNCFHCNINFAAPRHPGSRSCYWAAITGGKEDRDQIIKCYLCILDSFRLKKPFGCVKYKYFRTVQDRMRLSTAVQVPAYIHKDYLFRFDKDSNHPSHLPVLKVAEWQEVQKHQDPNQPV